jgi:hypothetical protein
MELDGMLLESEVCPGLTNIDLKADHTYWKRDDSYRDGEHRYVREVLHTKTIRRSPPSYWTQNSRRLATYERLRS